MLINDFIGGNSLQDEWNVALFDHEFEYLVQKAEKYTSIENMRDYLSQVLLLLQSTSIQDIAIRAEKDVLLLEDICRSYYNHKEHPSDYQSIAHKFLTLANFQHDDIELCMTLGVLCLSTNFRMWACRQYLYEIYDQAKNICNPAVDIFLFFQNNWHPVLNDIENWFKRQYADPTLAKIYLHTFDLKIIPYYTRRFHNKPAYEFLREYNRKHEHIRVGNS